MLYSLFMNNKDEQISKWPHYFPVYERHLKDFVNKSIVMIEIGVNKGGSLKMWRDYLGPFATIVGIDNNPDCTQYEDPQCKVCIGNQSDEKFLHSILRRFGKPDIVIDNGSHMMHDMGNSFRFFYPRLNNNGVYLVEDTHACYLNSYGEGLEKQDSFIEKSKALVDELHAYYIMDKNMVGDFTRSTFSVCFYDSIVVFEKRLRSKPYSHTTGNPDL